MHACISRVITGSFSGVQMFEIIPSGSTEPACSSIVHSEVQ